MKKITSNLESNSFPSSLGPRSPPAPLLDQSLECLHLLRRKRYLFTLTHHSGEAYDIYTPAAWGPSHLLAAKVCGAFLGQRCSCKVRHHLFSSMILALCWKLLDLSKNDSNRYDWSKRLRTQPQTLIEVKNNVRRRLIRRHFYQRVFRMVKKLFLHH